MRKPKIKASEIETISFKKKEQASFHFQFISPIFGGGVSTPDRTTNSDLEQKHPIRIASIRGHLRFWWRALVSVADPNINDLAQLKNKEAEIWGLASSPGKVATILKNTFKAQGSSFRESYLDFPLQGLNEDDRKKTIRNIQSQGELILTFKNVSLSDKIFIEDAVKAWMMFGGYGARTRRGMGAIKQVKEDGATIPFQNSDIQRFLDKYGSEKGIQGVPHLTKHFKLISVGSNSETALERGITRLKEFRQSPKIGRNEGQTRNRPGRSRWPEPDKIRRIARTHANNHAPTHPVEKFPRAAFGMPIIFDIRGQGEPPKHSLQPRGKERMASPLILKPIATGMNHYSSLAILLKEDKDKNFGVELVQIQGQRRSHAVQHELTSEEAKQIRPILEHGASHSDPLLAFLHFFENHNR